MSEAVLDQASTAKQAKPDSVFSAKNLILFGIVFFGVCIFFLPFGVLILLGLTPMLTAAFTDKDKKNYSLTLCVGMCNLAGITPFVVELARDGFSIEESLGMLSEPMVWLGIMASAGVGWGIYFAVPTMIRTAMRAQARVKISKLKARQRRLEELWGDEVMPNSQKVNPKIAD